MGNRSTDLATDCTDSAMDWAALGTRIRHTALLATAVHLVERARLAAETRPCDDASPRQPRADEAHVHQ